MAHPGPSAAAPSSSSASPPAAPPPPRPGKRRTLACAICRQRKLRCDRQQPACGMCVSRGQAHRCSYTDDPLPPSPATPPASAPWVPVAEPIYQRVNRLESILTRALSQLHTAAPPPALASSSASSTGSLPPPADKRALAQQLTSSVLYPSFWVSLTPPSCTDAVRHALSACPPAEIVRRSCRGYFDSVADFFAVVSLPSFESKLPRHDAFLHQVRAGSTAFERADVEFLALVLVVTMTGFVFAPDPGLYQWFYDTYQGRPIHTFMEAVLRLLHALDFRSRPTIETVRIELVSTFLFALSPSLWSPGVIAAGLVEEGMATQLHLDPPPDCTVEEYYDHMRLFVSLMTADMIGSNLGKRGPAIPLHAAPAFLQSDTWVWANDHSGFWTLPIMYRLHLTRLSSRAALRAEMDDDAAYAHTLELHRELDELHAALPASLKDALAHPERQAKRSSFALFMLRLCQQHMLISWHHHYYVQGWRVARRRRSVEEVYLHTRAYLETFLAFWAYLAPDYAVDALTPPVARDIIENHPHVGFSLSLFATPVLSIAALLRHHLVLTDLNPQNIIPCRTKERDEVHALLGRLAKLTFLLSPLSSVRTAPRRSTLNSSSITTPTGSSSHGGAPNTHSPSPVVNINSASTLPPAAPLAQTASASGSGSGSGNGSTPVVASYSDPGLPPTMQPAEQRPVSGGGSMGPPPLWSSAANWESCLRAVPDVQPLFWPAPDVAAMAAGPPWQ